MQAFTITADIPISQSAQSYVRPLLKGGNSPIIHFRDRGQVVESPCEFFLQLLPVAFDGFGTIPAHMYARYTHVPVYMLMQVTYTYLCICS